MEAIDRISLPYKGTEDERLDWLIERGRTIKRHNSEWRESKEAKERERLYSQEALHYKDEVLEEAVELFASGLTIKAIHAQLLEDHSEDSFFEVIPKKFEGFKTAFRRFRRRDEE